MIVPNEIVAELTRIIDLVNKPPIDKDELIFYIGKLHALWYLWGARPENWLDAMAGTNEIEPCRESEEDESK